MGGRGILFGRGEGGRLIAGVPPRTGDSWSDEERFGLLTPGVGVVAGPVWLAGFVCPAIPSSPRLNGGGRFDGLKEYLRGEYAEVFASKEVCTLLVGGVETVLGAGEGRRPKSLVCHNRPPLVRLSIEAPFICILSSRKRSGWLPRDGRRNSR
jgi:hypothetical protein